MSRPQPGFLLVSGCYQAFTLSDGALRMLVLLHLHQQGRSAWALMLVLLPYELAGIATNLLGGYLGARFGLRLTLVLGLVMQLAACALLAVDPAMLTLPYVMATQVLSGVAKDLVKTAAKSYTRILAGPADDAGRGLFGAVAWLTGSKNASKGLGFFAGGALLTTAGFRSTNLALALLLMLAAFACVWRLPRRDATTGASSLRQLLLQDAATNWLSAARLFLFGSRDAWFAVGLPLFLVAHGWNALAVGAALSCWVVGYGLVQATTPRWLGVADVGDGARQTRRWTAALLLPLAATGLSLAVLPPRFAVPLVAVGLCVYGAMFAVTSSLHSWLVVALHDDGSDRHVAERVGFYYAANAVGRLLGVTCSGALFALGGAHGLLLCLAGSVVLVLLATRMSVPLVRVTGDAA